MSDFINITATNCFLDASGAKIANGTLSVIATDARDNPIPFRIGSASGQASRQPVTRVITAGSMVGTLQLADPANSSPTNVLYRFTVTDNTTNKVSTYPKVFISPTAGAWDFGSMNTGALLPQIPFTVVTGPPGTNGTNGTNGSLAGQNKGIYSSTTTYALGDVVSFSGNSYVSLAGTNLNNSPTVATPTVPSAWWQVLAAAGAIGLTTTPANVRAYPSVNPNGLVSTSTLMPGFDFYHSGAAGSECGIDLGYDTLTTAFGPRLFAANGGNNRVILAAFHSSSATPAAQADIVAAVIAQNNKVRFFPTSSALDAITLDNSGATPKLLIGNVEVYVRGASSAPANLGANATVNPSNLASNTSLNPGINFYQFPGSELGMMLGYHNGKYSLLAFATTGQTFERAFHANGTVTSQTGFNNIVERLAEAGYSLFLDASGANPKFFVDNLGNITATSFTGAFTPPLGAQIPISDAILGNGSVSLVQARAIAMSRSQAPPSFSVPRSAMKYRSYGDSITRGLGASIPANNYPSLTAAALGITTNYTNRGVDGAQAADCANYVFNYENSSATSATLYSLMIGTNDWFYLGTGAHEPLFNTCHQAIVSWLGTRSEDRVDGGTVLGTNWSSDITFTAVTGAKSTTNGATNTYAITTYGKPLYVWSRIIDGNGGVFTITIDGGTPISVNCFGATTIATHIGATSSVQLTRIPVAAGAHSVVISVTSATSASNVVSIVSMGTPSQHVYYTSPRVAVGGINPQGGDLAQVACAQYTMDILDNVALLQRDGLDVVYVDNRSALQDGNPTLYINPNDLHCNDAGYALLAKKFIYGLTLPPSREVNRGTPVSSSANGTPGESWSDGSYVYGVPSFGTLKRVAIATW